MQPQGVPGPFGSDPSHVRILHPVPPAVKMNSVLWPPISCRPAVILRKNSQSSRSEKGAAVQAVLMSVLRTLKLRGHDPLKVIPEALRTYLTTSTLPPLPDAFVADG